MTGRIKSFSPIQGMGTIETQDGNELSFQVSDVLAFDRTGLSTGKVVGFVEEERFPKQAFAIFLCSGVAGYVVHDRAKQGDNLRYAGFHYEDQLRVYAFEERTVGQDTRKYLVETEVCVLLGNKVSLQETPSLCLAMLHHHLEADAFPTEQRLVRLRLTEADIGRFAAKPIPRKPSLYRRPGRGRHGEAQPDLDHSGREHDAQSSGAQGT